MARFGIATAGHEVHSILILGGRSPSVAMRDVEGYRVIDGTFSRRRRHGGVLA